MNFIAHCTAMCSSALRKFSENLHNPEGRTYGVSPVCALCEATPMLNTYAHHDRLSNLTGGFSYPHQK